MPNATMPVKSEATQCTLRFEKCKGGFKICCSACEQRQCADFQNLCRSLCDDNVTCRCTRDGIEICKFNLCSADCECDCKATKDGCCITCTSVDATCCEMLQACCDCLTACCQSGCCCYICCGDTCCCCGTCAA